MTDLPFEQWHPDAQRQCGFWWDLSPIACGQCERCRKEQRGHPVAPPTPQEPSEPQVDVVRLLRQCQDISHILGEVGCQAMPLVDGVRWLVDKQTALRVENTRLREREARLREALAACYEGLDTHWKEYPEHQPFIELARAALTPQGQSTDGETR